jgi:molybdenum cofactor cytidylyltransferase
MSERRVAGIVLAAGAATRMGQPKQLLDWGGVPLVRAVAQAALAAGLEELLVVTGRAGEEVERALADLPARCVYNPEYAQGQGTSLRAGVAALSPEADAALILLGDQPFVTPAIVAAIVAAWDGDHRAIVAPRYRGVRGNPVLFARLLFAELLGITGDQGARAILAARAGSIQHVDFDDDRPLADIDTIEEYQRLAPGRPAA